MTKAKMRNQKALAQFIYIYWAKTSGRSKLKNIQHVVPLMKSIEHLYHPGLFSSLRNVQCRALPFDDLDNFGDIPPSGMEVEDVEAIWWFVASRTSKKHLRARFKMIVQSYGRPFDCLSYVPISDNHGRGRYPRGVILILKQLLKPHTAILTSEDALYIQVGIWHELIEKAFQWIPTKVLPRHLKAMKLENDLGM
ncbi:hypothetical protein [Pseudomonas antarctica]|uniref:hypothetical protein n=1 Tax=Pseudomonas antarctica TaxID=219572 RepID=UPI003F74F618